MSSEQVQRALAQLRATADRLDGTQLGETAPPVPATPRGALSGPAHRVSLGASATSSFRHALTHAALLSATLVVAFTLGDPLLPRPDGPHLQDPSAPVAVASARDVGPSPRP
ncbi:MAG TPA: hypothetical protein VGA36_06085 [Nitriliruptorales bacterium]